MLHMHSAKVEEHCSFLPRGAEASHQYGVEVCQPYLDPADWVWDRSRYSGINNTPNHQNGRAGSRALAIQEGAAGGTLRIQAEAARDLEAVQVQMAATYASMALILALCALGGGIHGVSGHEGHEHTTHAVGAQLGWSVPRDGYNYSTWAANETFYNGDSLFFKYNASRHAVFQVTQADYNNCTISNCNATSCNATPLFTDKFVGNSNFTFTSEGDHWFICPVGQHCALGMKFKATVKALPSAAAVVSPGLGTAAAAAVVGLAMAFLSL